MILGVVVKFFYLALCKIRPEVEYLFNEVYLYYTMFIVFLLFSFLPSFLFFWSVLGFFFVIYLCVAGKIPQWLRTLLVLGKDPDFDSQDPYGSS